MSCISFINFWIDYNWFWKYYGLIYFLFLEFEWYFCLIQLSPVWYDELIGWLCWLLFLYWDRFEYPLFNDQISNRYWLLQCFLYSDDRFSYMNWLMVSNLFDLQYLVDDSVKILCINSRVIQRGDCWFDTYEINSITL